jgi:hypothetical protein
VVAYKNDPGRSLIAVCDKDEDVAKEVAAPCGARWTTSVGGLLDEGVGAVSVATPDHTHGGVVAELLKGGARHSTFEDGVANVRVISAVCESLQSGRVAEIAEI